jgi:hypothetical protein
MLCAKEVGMRSGLDRDTGRVNGNVMRQTDLCLVRVFAVSVSVKSEATIGIARRDGNPLTRSDAGAAVNLSIHSCTDMCKPGALLGVHCLPRITSLTTNEGTCGR